ncbi:anaphase-promoting complex subunit 2-like [Tubulanus polymorphus]|uniref:anaphase-promoting complex subunit 2-like n=1 Tax=Tubulanus polymorphus TaxID=672921 RepID=UPI003DA6B834
MDEAWASIESSLDPNKDFLDFTEEKVVNSVKLLQNEGLAYVIEEWFFETVQQELRTNVGPNFWIYFHERNSRSGCGGDGGDIIELFHDVVSKLYEQLSKFQRRIPMLNKIRGCLRGDSSVALDEDFVTKKVQGFYKAIMFYCTTKCFDDVVEQFYSTAFRVFKHQDKHLEAADVSTGSEADLLQCPGCYQDIDECHCQQILDKFNTVNLLLNKVGLLERICGESITIISHKQISQHIENTCKGNFESSYVGILENWLDVKVIGWFSHIYQSSRIDIDVSSFKSRLQHFLYETFANSLIDQLFNVIIEFPESEPAVVDLKLCLEKTDLRSQLVTSLKSALETRLLHPGVNTSDILTAYISAIRALRVLDHTGVVLELVCEPVRKYLRNRDDTVRCIVSSLTEDGSSDLSDELIKGQPLVLDESYHSDDENDDWENWMPDPVDADPAKTSKSRRTSDIISMLVNIYGSKELFVNEYRNLLADRILTQFSYDTEKEIRYLELLKLRFGEAQLHYCEVMLKDVADSRRINSNIADESAKNTTDDLKNMVPINTMVLSAQFWPTFREEKLQLPPPWNSSLENYTKSFEMLKGNRSLSWKPHLGLMNIDIELKDKKLNLNVSPVQATILWHFQEQEKWTLDGLSAVMHMPVSALRRKITFWQSQGILKEESADTFILIEEHKGRHHDIIPLEEDEMESAMASSEDQREEELQVYWSYVVGMLTNLESLPLDRIHSMLKMFAVNPTTTECSIPELKEFLDRKVKEQKLVYSGGVYRLAKS